jgi:hypothetical protein
MFSPRTPSLSVVTLALVLNLPASARAQAPHDIPGPQDTAGWLERNRQLAKDAFAATRSDPKELVRTRAAVAGEAFRMRVDTYLAGRGQGTVAFVTECSRLLLTAELDEAETPAKRLAALERHWLWTVRAEEQVERAYQSGKMSPGQVLAARLERLTAELAWARARALAPAVPKRAGAAAFLDGAGDELEASRHAARAKAAALRRTAGQLKQARLEAAAAELAEYFKEVRRGRVAAGHSLRERGERWLEAVRDARGPEADPTALAEQFWDFTKGAHDFALSGFERGVLPIDELATATYCHLDAELRLLQARPGAGKRPARGRPRLLDPGEPGPDSADEQDKEARHRAKARFAATQKTPAELLRGKLKAARTVVDVRRQMMYSGKLTVADWLDWWPRLLEADYAARGKPVDRAALAEARWRQMWEVKMLVQARHEAGQIITEEYLLAVAQVLDAELAWARARALSRPK